MKRVLIVAAAVLLIQLSAWADTINLVNRSGTIIISNAGIVSKGSQLSQFNQISNGHALGSVWFSTGVLLSGSIQSGGTFSSVGSAFQVIGMGNSGQPKGVIFDGAFVGTILWTLVSPNGQRLDYELSGDLSGQLGDGRTVNGHTIQMLHTTQEQLAKGIVHITSGKTGLSAVPEPGTLSLLTIGLLGIARVVRRRRVA